jgi:hypothetical protein
MKLKFIFLFFFALLAFCACNKDKINLSIITPSEGDTLSMAKAIDVVVEASTRKGSIIQVYLAVDTIYSKSITTAPYIFTIPAKTFTVEGLYPLAVNAYSSEGVREGVAFYIYIKE